MKYTLVFVSCFVLLFLAVNSGYGIDIKTQATIEIDEYFDYIIETVPFEQVVIWKIAEFIGLPFGEESVGLKLSDDLEFSYLILPKNRYGLSLEIFIPKDKQNVSLMVIDNVRNTPVMRLSMRNVKEIAFCTRFHKDGNLRRIEHKYITFIGDGVIGISNFDDWKIYYVGL